MEAPSNECKQLKEQADSFAARGDVYNAVKLYKRILRLAPAWLPPYLALAKLYKSRKEWKAVTHYNKKAVALDPSLQNAWWNLSLGAYANGKLKLARTIWSKFGKDTPFTGKGPIAVQIAYKGIFEILWVKPINPVSGIIMSIPQPAADFNYRDQILFDREIIGYQVAGKRKIGVYQCLDLLKRSHFNVFSGLVQVDQKAIQLFESLAVDQGIGFELWSNASESTAVSSDKRVPEYYSGKEVFRQDSEELQLVALAGRTAAQIKSLIHSWEVITLQQLFHLEQHR